MMNYIFPLLYVYLSFHYHISTIKSTQQKRKLLIQLALINEMDNSEYELNYVLSLYKINQKNG
jgi:hypothetical protein